MLIRVHPAYDAAAKGYAFVPDEALASPQDEAYFWRLVGSYALAKAREFGALDEMVREGSAVVQDYVTVANPDCVFTLTNSEGATLFTSERQDYGDGRSAFAVPAEALDVEGAVTISEANEKPTFRAEPIAPVPSICEQAIALGKLDEDDGLEYDGEFTAGVYRKVFPELFESREAV